MRAIHKFMDEMCQKLEYKDDGAAKFKANILEFLRAHSISSISAIVEIVTEPLLIEAKLRPVWPFVLNVSWAYYSSFLLI